MGNTKSINIISNNSKTCNDCEFKYNYQFDYCSKELRNVISIKEDALFFITACIDPDNKNKDPFKVGNQVIFKQKTYGLFNCYIRRKSITKYNKESANAELTMVHLLSENDSKESETNKDIPGILYVCIPIVILDSNNFNPFKKSSTNILSKIINFSKNLDKNKNKGNDEILVNEDINYNDLIPNSKYYVYEPKKVDFNNNSIYILFDKNDSAIEITQEDYDTLTKVINDTGNKLKPENLELLISDKEPIFTGSITGSIGSSVSNFFSSNSQTETQSNKKNNNKNQPDWLGFFISILTSILYIGLWAVIGCNILYFLYLDDLDSLFPSNIKKVPYGFGNFTKVMTLLKNIRSGAKKTFKKALNEVSGVNNISGGDNIGNEENNSNISNTSDFQSGSDGETEPLLNNIKVGGDNGDGDINNSNTNNYNNYASQNVEDDYYKIIYDSVNNQEKIDKIRKMFKLDSYGFPYSYSNYGFGLKDTFKNFIGESAKYSYSTGRGYIKTILNAIKETGNFGKGFMFIFMPFILYLCSYIVPFVGYILTLIGEINSGPFALLTTFFFSFVFGLSFIWPGIVSFVQTIQFLGTFLFLPLFIDPTSIKYILKDNSTILMNILLIMIILSTPSYLGTGEYGGSVIGVLSLILLYIDFRYILNIILEFF